MKNTVKRILAVALVIALCMGSALAAGFVEATGARVNADLVVLDPGMIGDRADFPGLGKPNAAPEGIRAVIVGGEIAAKDGRATGVMAGRALRQ